MQLADAPNQDIPDKDPVGVTRVLSVNGTGTVQAVTAAIDIQHTFVGDLRVTLTSPGGGQVVLQDADPQNNQQDLVKTFDSAGALRTFLGQPAAGDWKLNVADLDRLNVGKLRRWSLQITLG